MLDLLELERKLNEALANETKESLLEWLEGERLQECSDGQYYKELFGSGKTENLAEEPFISEISNNTRSVQKEALNDANYNSGTEYQFSMAA